MSKIKCADAILDYFCGDDSVRPFFKVPHRTEDYVFASSAACAVIFDKDCVSDAEKFSEYSGEKFKQALGIERDSDYRLSLVDVKDAISRVPVIDEYDEIEKEEDCPECDGTGRVEWEYDSGLSGIVRKYFECPDCKGLGMTIIHRRVATGQRGYDKYSYVSLLDFNVAPEAIVKLGWLMETLGIEEAVLSATKNDRLVAVDVCEGVSIRFCKIRVGRRANRLNVL